MLLLPLSLFLCPGDPGQTNVVVENNTLHACGTEANAIQVDEALLRNHANISIRNNTIYPQ